MVPNNYTNLKLRHGVVEQLLEYQEQSCLEHHGGPFAVPRYSMQHFSYTVVCVRQIVIVFLQ